MSKALAVKSPKAKDPEQVQKHPAEVTRQHVPRNSGGAVLALQRSAGNHAVNQSLGESLGTESSISGSLQRKCACGNNTMAGGECEECGKKRQSGLQTKLKVNEPGDAYEQEADRIADQVMTTSSHPAVSGVAPGIQRFSGQSKGQMNEAPASVDQVLSNSGRPLEPALRQDMEQRFGYDFSGVRIHTGAAAEKSADDVNANAYTVGQNIVFGEGRFAPGTHEGRRLLAHEFTHVMQQRGGAIAVQRTPAPEKRWSQDEKAARYRGRLMANRIRAHKKLSTEARDKINRELAYFEGKAKELYLLEVRPALLEVTEIEMPAEKIVPRGPRHIDFFPMPVGDPRLCGGRECLTDEQIYAPLTEMEKKEEAEKAKLREDQIQELKDKIAKSSDAKGWGDDQDFAVGLLEGILKASLHPDPRAVSDRIRQPILDRMLDYLKRVDKVRLDACAKNDPGLLAKIRGRARGDDPCVSWFATEHSHGPSELHHLESLLRLDRDTHGTAADKVYWEVLEYRKLTDPYWLEMARQAGEMVSGLSGLGRVPSGVTPRPVKPAAPPEPPTPVRPTRPVVTEPSGGPKIIPPEPRPVPSSKPPAKVTRDPARPPKVTTQREMEEVEAQKRVTVSAKKGKGGAAGNKADAPKTSGGAQDIKSKGKVAEEDLARIRQLDEWEKKNKITGDVQGLRARLRSKDPNTNSEARAEFDEAKAKIANGEKWRVEEYEEVPHQKAPKDTRISTAQKSELQDSAWLKRRLPAEKDRKDYMDWLKKGHKEGDLGEELKPGQKETEGHEHLSPGSPAAEESVRNWEREKGRRRD